MSACLSEAADDFLAGCPPSRYPSLCLAIRARPLGRNNLRRRLNQTPGTIRGDNEQAEGNETKLKDERHWKEPSGQFKHNLTLSRLVNIALFE